MHCEVAGNMVSYPTSVAKNRMDHGADELRGGVRNRDSWKSKGQKQTITLPLSNILKRTY